MTRAPLQATRRPRRSGLRSGLAGAATALAAVAALAAPAAAQEPDSTMVPVDSVIVSPDVPLATAVEVVPAATPMSPRGAFIRSMILPGWGQAAFDAHFRGGVFFAGWVGNWFMNFRNAVRLSEAKDIYGMRKRELADSLIAVSPNPDSTAAAIAENGVGEQVIFADAPANLWRKRVRAREEQREDWIAWTLFWILASGVDGYVTAHLSDFPAAIDLEPEGGGAVTVRFEVPVGPFGRPRP